jgi:ABC-type transporter Mla subunit MlaD
VKRAPRVSATQAGVAAIVATAIVVWLAFAGLPVGSSGYELQAMFKDVGGVDARTPVRIAGVEVGKVAKVEPAADGSAASVVTMELEDSALPLHTDATLKVRSRLFLEGNVFLDLRPGTPNAPELEDGGLIKLSHTAAPVRLGDVLNTFPASTRGGLQQLVKGYGSALSGTPEPGEDDDQDPQVKGLTAAGALNRSLNDAPEALRGIALVSDALGGEDARDVSRLIRGGQRVAGALASTEEELAGLVVRLNVTAGALARERRSLRAGLGRLPGVLEQAVPALDRVGEALPPARAFAREAIPGVRELPDTIETSLPWIAQTRRLVSKPELQGLVDDLAPAVDDLARTTDAAVPLLRRLDRVNRCALEVVLPTVNKKIADGPQSTRIANYKEFFQAMVGLTGESQNFDGNGPYTRLQPGGGPVTVKTGDVPGQGPLFGNASVRPLGTRPARPPKRPPLRSDVRCHNNLPPDLDSAQIGRGP